MSATVQELLSYCLIKIAKISKNKSIIISTHFDSIDSFKNAEEQDYLNIKFANGERALNLNANELARIKTLQHSNDLDGYLSPSQNFTKLYAENFLRKQIDSINSLRIENLNCNPILVTSLKLDTPEKLLTYSVYQSSSRSIVTSFGFFVQELLLSSGENIFDAKDEISHHGTKWDLVKRLNDVQSWIEVKSGPNDLNRTQILSYKTAIESIEQLGEKAYIGETYGTRDQNTVTHGLYRQYLDNWENRTLIGRELWTFVSDDVNYHEKLMTTLREVAQTVLHENSVIDAIGNKINELKIDFNNRFASVDEYVDTLW